MKTPRKKKWERSNRMRCARRYGQGARSAEAGMDHEPTTNPIKGRTVAKHKSGRKPGRKLANALRRLAKKTDPTVGDIVKQGEVK